MTTNPPHNEEEPKVSEQEIAWPHADSFFGYKTILVLLFHYEQEQKFRVRIKEPQYIPFLIYGIEAGEIYVHEGFIGEGKSPGGAYSALSTLIADEVVKYKWQRIVQVVPETQKKYLPNIHKNIMERIKSGKSGIRDF